MAIAFEKRTFAQQLTALKGALLKTTAQIQAVSVRAHTEYAQEQQEFDAVARVLNTVREGQTLRTALNLAKYIAAHGPYQIEFKPLKDNKAKSKFYCKLDKAENANPFIEMVVAWNEWDDEKQEVELKGVDDIIKLIKRVANDTEHKRYDADAVLMAVKAVNFMETEAAKAA